MWRLFLIGTKAPVVVVQVALVYSDFFLICPEPPRMHLTPLLPRLRIVATIAALLILTACAGTRPMPYSSEKPTVKSEDGPVLLMTLTMKNKFAPKHHPLNVAANILKRDGSEEEIAFDVSAESQARETTSEQGSRFLIRFQLKPGDYRLLGFAGITQSFPLIGRFFLPLHTDFTVPTSGIFYLGEANAINRERTDDRDFRSGPIIPLWDQASSGFAHGTFDVTIEDLLDTDLPTFQSRFAPLKGVQIEKMLLPQPDKKRAVEYWLKK